MRQKTLFLRMPLSILFITLLANMAGLYNVTLFQFLHVFFSSDPFIGHISFQTFVYSYRIGLHIAFFAVPISILTLMLVTFVTVSFKKWQVVFILFSGLAIGCTGFGSFYWGVPIFSYVVTTSALSCVLIIWRQSLHRD